MLELVSLSVLTPRSVLFLSLTSTLLQGGGSQTGALPLEAVMVLAGVVLLEREGLSNFKLFSFTSQSHRRHGGSV